MFIHDNEVENIIHYLTDGHKRIFAERLIGYYIYGSLVWGDFDVTTSDVDTLCVLASEITPQEFTLLQSMPSKQSADMRAASAIVSKHANTAPTARHMQY